ncbi:RNA polymerase II elongation factor ELL-like isoform X1 [Ostrea edulis]|uniref:RNA polymerase II elongation factor ELL-like isoform X1 n=1 Tax=Ostrea edulis TaxID=37623 RepID=UPI0024AEE4FE|nr:RNA polymerase II elongation factor ELL-like isoform X1 [Ostrea edulis]
MATLVEGEKYGLSSTSANYELKSVVHVKLTDSALKTIEDLLKCKDKSKKPSISFNGNQGVINLPARDSNHSKAFQFTVSSLGDTNGLDCVQQTDSKNGKQLVNMGTMSTKLAVHATSDVFRMTKETMKTAQEEWTKVRTQEIKPSGRNIGRKIKRVKRESELKNPIPPTRQEKEREFDLKNRIQEAKRDADIRLMMQQHSVNNSKVNPIQSSAIKTNKTTAVVSPFTNNSSSRKISPSQSPHEVSSTTGGAPSPSYPSSQPVKTTKSAVMAAPLRERIVHLLALRSYKKPELYLRLVKDGLNDADRKEYNTFNLEELAVLNQKDLRYNLSKHVFSEVKIDWPYYTDQERELVKKKLQSLSPVSSPATSHPSPKASPTSSTQVMNCYPNHPPNPAPQVLYDNELSPQPSPKASPTSSTQKRPCELPEQNQPSKKQRISHYRKENRPALTETAENRESTVNGRSHKKENIDDFIDEASSTSETPDYFLKYIAISSGPQRAKYKQDFNTEYQEYRDLHDNVEKVTRKFTELETLMRQTQPGTEEFENLKNRIRQEYKYQKDDHKYMEQKKRFEYLHKKLGHIKRLILEYDNSQVTVS